MIARLIGLLPVSLRDRSGLAHKIMASAALSSVSFIGQMLLRIVSTMVLTRLLAPETFGVFAVVLAFLYILTLFSDMGVRGLILTREGEVDDGFLRACWTVQILRGALILALCGLIALALAGAQGAGFFGSETAYADPMLPYAVAATGFAPLVKGFASPVRFLYERRITFQRVTVADLAEAAMTLVAVVALAFWMRSIWALVIGHVIGALVHVALSFALFRGSRMRPNWDRENFRIIISRGKWIMSNSALNAGGNIADRFLLGFAMTAGEFGFYYIARQIIDLGERFLQVTHRQMGLQVFRELQRAQDLIAFRRRYYRYRLFFDALAMFGAGVLLTFAPTLVGILYDDRYAEVAGMIQVLSVGLVLIGPGLLREAFNAERRFRAMATLGLLRAVTIWAGLGLAVFGFRSVPAALLVIALHRVPEIALLLLMGIRRGWVDILREIRILPLAFLGAAAGWAMASAIAS